MLTGAVLRVTLVLWMEIVESIGHYILGVDSFLFVFIKKERKRQDVSHINYISKRKCASETKQKVVKTKEKRFQLTFKLLEMLCMVTVRPRESVAQFCA